MPSSTTSGFLIGPEFLLSREVKWVIDLVFFQTLAWSEIVTARDQCTYDFPTGS